MSNHTKLSQKTKSISHYILLILMGISLFVSSCKKKEAAPAAKPDDVYVAGFFTSKGGSQYPAYWKNGNLVQLSTSEEGIVKAIAVSDKDVYCVGYLYTSQNQIVLWKNKTLIPVTLNTDPEASAYGIAVLNGEVYVAGYQIDPTNNNLEVAKYWKIGIDNIPHGTPLGKGSNGSNNAEASAIAISTDHIYVTGYVISQATGHSIAVLWENGPIYTSYQELTDGNFNAYGNGIAITGTDAYIGGGENGTVKYWKNDKNQVTAVGSVNHSAASYNCIALNGNKVYMAGTDHSGVVYKAMYWNNVTPVPLNGGNGVNEYAYQTAVAGNNVYVTGGNDISNASYLWRNGSLVPPFDGKDKTISATALYVVKN